MRRPTLVSHESASRGAARWLIELAALAWLIAAAGAALPAAQMAAAAGRKVATPVISPSGGTFESALAVTISSPTPATTLFYTVDGSSPSASSPVYTGPIVVSTTTTVKAIGIRKNWMPSDVAMETFAMNFGKMAPPLISPAQGTYDAPLAMTIAAENGTIRYSIDGSAPDETSAIYVSPVVLTESATVRARVFQRDYTPSDETAAVYTLRRDVTPPLITASLSEPANAAGWHASPVTVTFACTDEESAIASCTPPVTVTAEGSTVVRGQATDAAGNSAELQVVVNVDLTSPVLAIISPAASSVFPSSTASVVLEGTVQDVSGISTLTCAGVQASMTGSAYACNVPVTAGTNSIRVDATDLAGYMSSLTITVRVAEAGDEPSSIEVSPEALLMSVGDVRGLAVVDDRGRAVQGGVWSFSAPIAEVAQVPGTCHPETGETCLEPNDLTIVRALSPGEVTVTVSYLGLTTQSTLSILAAATAPATGTPVWMLSGSTPQPPVRAQVLTAVPQPDGDPVHEAALFFVDEGRQWVGSQLASVNGSTLHIRATTADGRELWRMRDAGPALLKYGAVADQMGGIIVVMQNGYDDARQSFYPDKVRRLDGRDGFATWEYVPEWFYTLSEPAVHQDGTVYFTEQAGLSTDPPSHLVGIAPGGGVIKWTLPTGSFTRHDSGTGLLEVNALPAPALAGQALIRDDGTVVLLARTLESTQYVMSYYDANGNLTWRNDTSQVPEFIYSGWVIEMNGGVLRTEQLARGASLWSSFRPQDWKLLPDGQDGLLAGHRSLRSLLHVDASYQVMSGVLATGSGTTYGMEYVLGADGAYALEHGVLSGSYWSKTYRFDPVTLSVSDTTWVTFNGTQPSNLRLQFAADGGGVYLSGPGVSPTSTTTTFGATSVAPVGNATQIADGIWAGWGSGPTLVTADGVATADTAWPHPQGSVSSTNAAVNPGFGIFVKSHSAFLAWSHASLRIVPKNQALWLQRMPAAFANVDAAGRHFATIGAGPDGSDTSTNCDGSLALISAINRPTDVSQQAQRIERLMGRVHSSEDETIQALFDLDAAYGDRLPYCYWPGDSSGSYNSNSYIAGLLRTAYVPPPFAARLVPILYPGWTKPVPPAFFVSQ